MPTTTQTVTPMAPPYDPYRWAWEQLLLQQAMQNIGWQDPLSQLASSIMLTGQAPEPITPTAEQIWDIKDPYNKAVAQLGGIDKASQQEAFQSLRNINSWETNIESGGVLSMPYRIDEAKRNIESEYKKIEALGLSREDINEIKRQYVANPQYFEGDVARYGLLPSEQKATVQEALRPPGVEPTPGITTPAIPGPAEAVPTEELPWWEQYPESPLAPIMAMTPEAVEKEITRQEELATRGVEDWYSQAAREAEQRAIRQYGGYLGTAPERDYGAISVERGRRLGDIQAQAEARRGLAPFETGLQKLQALEPLRQFGMGYGLQQQAPWLGVATGYYNVPWGQQVTTTQPEESLGLLGTLGSLASTGLGTYGIGKGLGWWGGGSAATPYSLGLVGGPTGFGAMSGMFPIV